MVRLRGIRVDIDAIGESHRIDIITHLLDFDRCYDDLPALYLLRVYMMLMCETVKMTPYMTSQIVIATFGYFYLNIIGDSVQMAAFGIFNFMYMIFFYLRIFAGSDKIGIELSNSYGAKKYQNCKIILRMGFLHIVILFVFVSFPKMFWAKDTLNMMGISSEIAVILNMPAKLSLLVMCIHMCHESLQNFCIAQGLEAYFWRMGILNLFIAIPGNYIAICKLKLGISGFILVRLMTEIVKLANSFYVYSLSHPETIGLPTVEECLKYFGGYFLESIKYTMGTYA